MPPIGERIRAERVRQGLSLRGLARHLGVSASLISQIETDKSKPSVSTLYGITMALGMSVEDLFVAGEPSDSPAAPPPEPAAVPTAGAADVPDRAVPADSAAGSNSRPLPPAAGAPSLAAGYHSLGSDRMRRVGPVVRPERREALRLDSGVIWERLGQVPGVEVDFLRVTYEPGSASSSSGDLMRHSGTEYAYLMSGELVLTLGFDEYRLSPGDAISFESTRPHGYRNEGAEPAVGLWVVLEDAR